MKTLILCLPLLLLISCASQRPKKSYKPSYSAETENEFESIENDRQKVLDHYRRLRERNWDTYKSKGKRQVPRKKSYPNRHRRTVRKTPKKEPGLKPPLDPKAVEELKIEMGQYMSYFCMSNRKRFEGADCSAFTENALHTCENKYPIIRDRKIVSCLKTKLR